MSPPTDLLALLAAYKVNPDDTIRGLILADWLEEHGDPVLAARAEFVRLQSQAPRAAGSKQRQAELLQRHAAHWLGPLRAVTEAYAWHHGLLHLWVAAATLAGESARGLTAEDQEVRPRAVPSERPGPRMTHRFTNREVFSLTSLPRYAIVLVACLPPSGAADGPLTAHAGPFSHRVPRYDPPCKRPESWTPSTRLARAS